MDVTPERISIVTGLLALFTAGKMKIWIWGHQLEELKLSHERERKQWETQFEQIRAELKKAEEREKVLFGLVFDRRELLQKAVDLAVDAKAA